MCFDIAFKVSQKSLMNSARNMLKEEEINAILKRVTTGWDTKPGFVAGSKVEVVSMAEYEKEFQKIIA